MDWLFTTKVLSVSCFDWVLIALVVVAYWRGAE